MAVAPPDLEKARRLLGLGLRARTVVVGVQQVRSAVMDGGVELAIVAEDASPHSRAKVVPLLQARGVQVVGGVTAGWLGAAVGRESVAAVAVVEAGLARGIRAAMAAPTDGWKNGGMG